MRVSWTARRSNQSILKEINPEYSLEGPMLKFLKEINPEYSLERPMLKQKLQYFGHLMRKTDSLEKTQMLGKIEGKKRRGQQRRGWLDSITDSKDEFEQTPGDSERPGSLVCYSPWGHKELDMT